MLHALLWDDVSSAREYKVRMPGDDEVVYEGLKAKDWVCQPRR